MIGSLRGMLQAIEKNELLIDTGGVGYWVTLGEGMRMQMELEEGKEVFLYIHTSVREDDIRLFGFPDLQRRNLFLLLTGVNGVGPKAGVAILDQMAVGEIIVSIQHEDYKPFTRVSGVGTKTAQRIVVDLQGKLNAFADSKIDFTPGPASAQNFVGKQSVALDARSALMNLGFPDKEADKVIQNHLEPEIQLDELLKLCLMDLRK